MFWKKTLNHHHEKKKLSQEEVKGVEYEKKRKSNNVGIIIQHYGKVWDGREEGDSGNNASTEEK